jgi:hypothetical protein
MVFGGRKCHRDSSLCRIIIITVHEATFEACGIIKYVLKKNYFYAGNSLTMLTF